MKPRRILTAAEHQAIGALKGSVPAVDVANRFGCARDTVHAIWQGKARAPARQLDEAQRARIVALKGAGKDHSTIIRLTGWSDASVRRVLAEARAEGDNRADPNPAIRLAAEQRVAASAGHREGGAVTPDAPALAPNSMELSLRMRGVRPEVAAATARAWRDRHAHKNGGRRQ